MIVVACIALLIGTLAYVFAPVAASAPDPTKSRLQYLYERREAIYENLRDLNFEHKSGKYPDADYDAMRTNLEDEAAGVLAEIAKLEKN